MVVSGLPDIVDTMDIPEWFQDTNFELEVAEPYVPTSDEWAQLGIYGEDLFDYSSNSQEHTNADHTTRLSQVIHTIDDLPVVPTAQSVDILDNRVGSAITHTSTYFQQLSALSQVSAFDHPPRLSYGQTSCKHFSQLRINCHDKATQTSPHQRAQTSSPVSDMTPAASPADDADDRPVCKAEHLTQVVRITLEIASRNGRRKLPRILAPIKSTSSGKNKRSRNIENVDPTKFYVPLQHVLKDWGRLNETGQSLFSYTAEGELWPDEDFTPTQIVDFIYGEPHWSKDSLILRIQKVPADSRNRYTFVGSNKCRFKDCPMAHRTLSSGQFRVAFDENSKSQEKLDPYHCAGTVQVEAEGRQLLEGPNKMEIYSSSNRQPLLIVESFKDFAKAMSESDLSVERPFDYESTLCAQLTAHKIASDPDCRGAKRETAAGNTLSDHKGDLEVMVRKKYEQYAFKTKAESTRISRRKKSRHAWDISEVELTDLDS